MNFNFLYCSKKSSWGILIFSPNFFYSLLLRVALSILAPFCLLGQQIFFTEMLKLAWNSLIPVGCEILFRWRDIFRLLLIRISRELQERGSRVSFIVQARSWITSSPRVLDPNMALVEGAEREFDFFDIICNRAPFNLKGLSFENFENVD